MGTEPRSPSALFTAMTLAPVLGMTSPAPTQDVVVRCLDNGGVAAAAASERTGGCKLHKGAANCHRLSTLCTFLPRKASSCHAVYAQHMPGALSHSQHSLQLCLQAGAGAGVPRRAP